MKRVIHFVKTLRERFLPIRFLVEAQKTIWYPITFAVLCTIGGTSNHKIYLPVLYVLCAFVLFSVFFADDNKVFIVPLFMIYYCVGFDNHPSSFSYNNGDMLAAFDMSAFVQMMVCAVIVVGAFIIRLIADGSIIAAFKKRRAMTISILALDAAFLLNGVFSTSYTFKNLLYGAIIALVLTIVYFLAGGMLEKSQNVIPYACETMVCLSYTVLSQVLLVTCKSIINKTFFIEAGNNIIINRYNLSLGWGVTTVIGAVLVLGIPAALYLASNEKLSGFSFVSALFFLLGSFLINARSAMIVGTLIFFVCAVYCCIRGINRVKNLFYIIIFVLIPLALFIYCANNAYSLPSPLQEFFTKFQYPIRGDSGRIELWKDGISDFKSAPIFGIGFNDGAYPTDPNLNIYSNMYHNIGIEFLGATGIFGCLAFAFHLIQLIVLFLKKFSDTKFFLLLICAMIIGMSIVDNFFFYINFQIFYSSFLILSEIQIKNDIPNDSEIHVTEQKHLGLNQVKE